MSEHVFVVPASPPLVRSSWLQRILGQLQVALGALVLQEPESIGLALTSAVRSMPAPATPLEELLLRGVLFDVAIRTGEELHHRVCRGRAPCRFVSASLLPQFWSGREAARDAFTAWMEALVVQLRLVHPVSP